MIHPDKIYGMLIDLSECRRRERELEKELLDTGLWIIEAREPYGFKLTSAAKTLKAALGAADILPRQFQWMTIWKGAHTRNYGRFNTDRWIKT